jgi:hypothetical protein
MRGTEGTHDKGYPAHNAGNAQQASMPASCRDNSRRELAPWAPWLVRAACPCVALTPGQPWLHPPHPRPLRWHW